MLVGVLRTKGVECGEFCVVSRQEFVLVEYGESNDGEEAKLLRSIYT